MKSIKRQLAKISAMIVKWDEESEVDHDVESAAVNKAIALEEIYKDTAIVHNVQTFDYNGLRNVTIELTTKI